MKMVEDIGKIISNGFETYTKNLNLSVPFIINVIITGLLSVIMFFGGFFYIFGSSLSSLKNATTPGQFISIILPLISQHLLEIVLLIIIYFLIVSFFESFFLAGAIGMAQKATETGKSELSSMIEVGKKNVINLYLAGILVGLLSLAGIIFIVPGAMKINITQVLSFANTGATLLLIGGFLLWVVYLVILSLVLAIFTYALVIDNLGPIDGILAGFRFFSRHKLDVFMLWLVIGVIVILLMIIGQVMVAIPVMNIIWPFINMFISILVIPPLTTLWWVRLYMTRTGKKIYFNELLAHPNELEKLKANL
jgi:hypothetical protein